MKNAGPGIKGYATAIAVFLFAFAATSYGGWFSPHSAGEVWRVTDGCDPGADLDCEKTKEPGNDYCEGCWFGSCCCDCSTIFGTKQKYQGSCVFSGDAGCINLTYVGPVSTVYFTYCFVTTGCDDQQ